ncbi:MAG: FAD-dependent thymidylate synthase [Microbacterium gubbeenense]|uniref:FAD-dependent thymidylate synthase n=1 Tax=Microbacterium gubbeenense TaxID=159896 RepID=UPI003F973B9D
MTQITLRSDMGVQLIDSMGDEQSIVRAARVSTLGAHAEADEAAGLVRFLMREGHGTPFEAPELQFRFEVPIFISRQIVKHRISSINEESGRYRELEPVFYVPNETRSVVQTGKTGEYRFVPDAAANLLAYDTIADNSMTAWAQYEKMLSQGIAKEVARMVLPVNIYSTMYVKTNLRSWLNFVKLRTTRYGSHAQHEIALVGEQVSDVLIKKFPTVMAQFDIEQKVV